MAQRKVILCSGLEKMTTSSPRWRLPNDDRRHKWDLVNLTSGDMTTLNLLITPFHDDSTSTLWFSYVLHPTRYLSHLEVDQECLDTWLIPSRDVFDPLK